MMLDPKDWAAFRAASHRALDAALDNLQTVRDRPVWQSPAPVRAHFDTPAPEGPTPFADVVAEFERTILPYPVGNQHPRFFGWVQGTATPSGAIADLLASLMDPNVGGRDHAAIYVERQVIRWFRDLFDFPTTASGVMTLGSSVANMLAIIVARTRALGSDRDLGLQRGAAQLVGYVSTATHQSLRKAFDATGLGIDALRILPVDRHQRMDPARLRAAIDADERAGKQPFVIVGNAGSVSSGAIDPLDEIANVASQHNIWFHVDGAFGALAALSPPLRPLLRGMERADSLVFDFHKWLHVPYDAGCILVRDGALHQHTFEAESPYLRRAERGLAAGSPWFADFGIDLSRGFRALKVWFAVKEHGTKRLGESIENNVRQAHKLAEMIAVDDALELVTQPELNVVCFRYRAANLDLAARDEFTSDLAVAVQESGQAVISTTTIDGHRTLRACIVNHRTEDNDLQILLEVVKQQAKLLLR